MISASIREVRKREVEWIIDREKWGRKRQERETIIAENKR